MAQHNILGKDGEDIAVDYLVKKGYKILARNFQYQKAEVDIIARKGDVLAAVEVKTRSSSHFGDPEEFVKKKQIQQLLKVVDFYVVEEDLDVEVRFDIIAIISNKSGIEIKHLEDAITYF